MRAEGFTLFVAVCNSPTMIRDLIRWLKESMPGTEIRTVELDATTKDVLAETLRQVGEGAGGPVMIVGLEKASPGSETHHPVLQVLNFSRPEWPERLPCPVVFWVPEYLLRLLGREAPDFMDWRSDTLFFLRLGLLDAVAFESDIWGGELDRSMTEEQRLRRIEELRSRLALQPMTDDTLILSARSDWLAELGNHLLLLGEVDQAEEVGRAAFEIRKCLLPRKLGSSYTNLGLVSLKRGKFLEAEELLSKALQFDEEAGDSESIAKDYLNLGALRLKTGDLVASEGFLEKALGLFEEANSLQGRAKALMNLASLHLRQSGIEASEKALRASLKVYEHLGDLEGLSVGFANLGVLHQYRGDLEGANENLRRALDLSRLSGDQERLAGNYMHLGSVALERGELDQAEDLLRQSLDISEKTGNIPNVADCLVGLGWLYMARKAPDRAVQSWEAAYRLFEQADMSQQLPGLKAAIANAQESKLVP